MLKSEITLLDNGKSYGCSKLVAN
uniref:Uncharacterized protein n=1 Tax=Rhizophora mucronata TaxID=61149 RepID=A0A2P2IV79_RHIMU